MKGNGKMRFVVFLACVSVVSCLPIWATFANDSEGTKYKEEDMLSEGKINDFQDGSRDATEFIQHNLDQAAETHGEVFLPSGRYRLDGTLTIPPGVILSGTWRAPHHAQLSTGTVLLAYNGRGQEDGTPLISLSPSSAIRGLTIFYPEQTIEDVQPYPWTIQGRGMHNSVIDVTLVNPYDIPPNLVVTMLR